MMCCNEQEVRDFAQFAQLKGFDLTEQHLDLVRGNPSTDRSDDQTLQGERTTFALLGQWKEAA